MAQRDRNSRGNPSSDALHHFVSAIRHIPVLPHAEMVARFRALAADEAEFRSALYAMPDAAERLVQRWQQRRAAGLVTGLLVELESRSAGERSHAANTLFSSLDDLCQGVRAARPNEAVGIATQIRERLEAGRVELGVLLSIHDELHKSPGPRGGTELETVAALDSLERASRARSRWEAQRADLVRHNLKLVINVAKRFKRREVPLLELIQEGAIGLVRAVEKFDPERGFRFSTYAVWWIEQAVIRGIQKAARTIRLPTHVHEQQVQLRNAEIRLRASLPDALSPDRIADELQLSLDEADVLVSTLKPIRSLQAPLGDEPGHTLEDTLPDEDDKSLDEEVCRHEVRSVLDRSFDSLTLRERQVVGWRFGLEGGSPESLESIGKRLQLSRERIRQIESRILDKLRERPDIQSLADSLPGHA